MNIYECYRLLRFNGSWYDILSVTKNDVEKTNIREALIVKHICTNMYTVQHVNSRRKKKVS